MKLLAKLGILLLERVEPFIYSLSVARSCLVHTLFDATFGDEGFLEGFQVTVHHGVHLKAEGEADVGKFLLIPLLGIPQIIFGKVVGASEVLHRLKTCVPLFPQRQLMLVDVIAIVFAKLSNTRTSHIEKFQLHLR